MNPLPPELTHTITMLIGALCAYFGAMNAMRERLAKLEARADANERDAVSAFEHAQSAHQRIDSWQHK